MAFQVPKLTSAKDRMMLNALAVHGYKGGPHVISKSKRSADMLYKTLIRSAEQGDPRSQSILAAKGNGKKHRCGKGKFMHLKKGTPAAKAYMARLRSMRK
jgi:hypothetical protein